MSIVSFLFPQKVLTPIGRIKIDVYKRDRFITVRTEKIQYSYYDKIIHINRFEEEFKAELMVNKYFMNYEYPDLDSLRLLNLIRTWK